MNLSGLNSSENATIPGCLQADATAIADGKEFAIKHNDVTGKSALFVFILTLGAKAALEELEQPSFSVEIIPVESDCHDRAVGLVLLKGILLNREQICNGHAWVYETYCRARFCGDWKQGEKEARAKNRGLWSGEGALAQLGTVTKHKKLWYFSCFRKNIKT